EPIQRINPRAPDPLCWIVERCLTKDPNERYASTKDLARELRTIRDRLKDTGYGNRLLSGFRGPHRMRALIAASLIAGAIVVGILLDISGRLRPISPRIPGRQNLAVLTFQDVG